MKISHYHTSGKWIRHLGSGHVMTLLSRIFQKRQNHKWWNEAVLHLFHADKGRLLKIISLRFQNSYSNNLYETLKDPSLSKRSGIKAILNPIWIYLLQGYFHKTLIQVGNMLLSTGPYTFNSDRSLHENCKKKYNKCELVFINRTQTKIKTETKIIFEQKFESISKQFPAWYQSNSSNKVNQAAASSIFFFIF